MSEKTNYSSYIPWLNALFIAIIAALALAYFNIAFTITVTQAIGISAVQSINVFSDGVAGTDPFWYERLTMLGSIILIFVAGPVLWGMGSKSSDNVSQNIMWYAGVVLLLIGFIHVSMGLTYQAIKADQWETAEQSRNKDQLRAELLTLNNRAMELYWLPIEQNGTSRDLSKISLQDLKQGTSFQNTYAIDKTASDSTLTIYGMGTKEGTNSAFKNVDGQRGKIQLAVQIKPQNLETNWLRADSLTN
jgi:hypothetical protein